MEHLSIESLRNSKEPIDKLYVEEYISEREYLASMRFRWLYAQVFGSSQIKAYDFAKISGRDINKKEYWLEEKAQEYNIICEKLIQKRYYQIIFDICILNREPAKSKIRIIANNLKEALIYLDNIFGYLKIRKFHIIT